MDKARVLVAEPLAPEGVDILREQTQVDEHLDLDRARLLEAVPEYDALIVRSQTRVDAELIKAGTKLQVIARAGAGVDNIDVEAATRRGIVVVNAPTANVISAAEHAMALMMALARHIPQAHSLLQEGVWRRTDFIGVELRNKTLGLVGLGNVGSAVARRAQGFDINVIVYDPYVSHEYCRHLGVQLVSLDELLRTSDFISLHVPLTDSTRGLIGAKELAKVKPTVRIINTARGGLLDEKALYQALEAGTVAGAAVDVFTVEPAGDNILCRSPKVIVTPHIAGSTAEAQAEIGRDIAHQVISVLQGKPTPYAVNAPYIPVELQDILSPFLPLVHAMGHLMAQLAEGVTGDIRISYQGEISNYDTRAIKATILQGLLEEVSVERVNLVNADQVAQRRRLRITEQKTAVSEVYPSLITLEVATGSGPLSVSGTSIQGEPHIVWLNEFRIDVIPTGGYFLFSEHLDRPGMIGAVGTICGEHDINIHSLHFGRVRPRGLALMVLGVDEAIPDEVVQKILALPDISSAKVVRL
ncbi:MAG: phosphoglycerate dehydrogenase [Dehalococcoidia bacterium]